MLIGEEPEVRPPPVPAIMMPIPEAIVRTPQQRRRYILKQDVARYGPTPECEACTTLAARAQRVTKPHSDESRARMEELTQRDEDALGEAAIPHRQTPKRLDRCGSERR